MTVYVLRGGRLVEKVNSIRRIEVTGFPTPMLSRMEPFESPVTGKEITSWRERDADMKAAGAVDPRDLPPPTRGRKQEERHGRPDKPDQSGFQWGGPGG